MSSLGLRGIEGKKIDCARKFFKKLEDTGFGEKVKYEVITDYDKLMSAVGKPAAGQFGADTQASLTNDGPVTFMWKYRAVCLIFRQYKFVATLNAQH